MLESMLDAMLLVEELETLLTIILELLELALLLDELLLLFTLLLEVLL